MILLGRQCGYSWAATGTVLLVVLVTLLNSLRHSSVPTSGSTVLSASELLNQVGHLERGASLQGGDSVDASSGLGERLLSSATANEEEGGEVEARDGVGEEEGGMELWQPEDSSAMPASWWVDTVKGFSSRAAEYTEVFQSIPEHSDRYMVIIEPRRFELLEHVLRNFIFYLAPKGWGLVVCHGPENRAFARKIVKGWRHVHLRELDMGGSVSQEEYSRLLVSESFWENLPGEHQLVFQSDCFLRDDAIDRWMQYDYVGAPWSNWVDRRLRGRVGNGGLSLRKKQAMLRCIREVPWDGHVNEDIYFSIECAPGRLHVPGEREAMEFVVETVWDDKRPPLGFHHAWQYLEYDHDDLAKNDVYRVMAHYNVQPFLDKAEHTGTDGTGPGEEAAGRPQEDEGVGVAALKKKRRHRWW